MAHNLENYDGRRSMAYTGKTPWHGLGESMPEGATVEEFFEKSRLNYTVKLGTVSARLSQEHYLEQAPSFRAVMRVDTGKVLGIVSPRYSPVQNSELAALGSVFESDGRVKVDTAGVLGHGEQVWMMLRWDTPLVLPGDDVVHPYLLLTNAHTGKSSMEAGTTTVRVVCQNTLSIARRSSKLIKTRHTGNIPEKLKIVATTLGASAKGIEEFGHLAAHLQSQTVEAKQVDEFWLQLVPGEHTRSKNIRAAMQDSFESAPGAQSTRWGLVNAVTHYVDHVRGRTQDQTKRAVSALFGGGADLKQTALALAAKM